MLRVSARVEEVFDVPQGFSSLNFFLLAQVINGSYDKVKTWELDSLASETAAYLATEHPDYSLLAGRIAVSALHRVRTKVVFCIFVWCSAATCLLLAASEQAGLY